MLVACLSTCCDLMPTFYTDSCLCGIPTGSREVVSFARIVDALRGGGVLHLVLQLATDDRAAIFIIEAL